MNFDQIIMTSIKLLAVVVLVFVNGFFVAAEFALVKLRRTQLDTLVAKGQRRALMALKLITHLDATLSATQLGITSASLALGWIGEPFLALRQVAGFVRLPSQPVGDPLFGDGPLPQGGRGRGGGGREPGEHAQDDGRGQGRLPPHPQGRPLDRGRPFRPDRPAGEPRIQVRRQVGRGRVPPVGFLRQTLQADRLEVPRDRPGRRSATSAGRSVG